jgi:hypothetical protein
MSETPPDPSTCWGILGKTDRGLDFLPASISAPDKSYERYSQLKVKESFMKACLPNMKFKEILHKVTRFIENYDGKESFRGEERRLRTEVEANNQKKYHLRYQFFKRFLLYITKS